MILEKKTIVLTGANGLLGLNFTKFLISQGARVIALDINLNQLNKNFKNNNNIIKKKLDVKKEKSWKSLLNFLKKKKIKVDVLINGAGFTNNTNSKKYNNNFFELSKKHYNEVMDINLFGSILGCQFIGKEMLKRKKGSIINIASMYGIKSPKHFIYPGTGISAPLTYALSKSSVVMLTKYLGTLFAKNGVRVNSISPGGIQQSSHSKKWLKRFASMCPSKRMGKPNELFGAILYLSSDMSSYSNASNIVVDGGWTSW